MRKFVPCAEEVLVSPEGNCGKKDRAVSCAVKGVKIQHYL